jgi:hypothetical protein
MKHSSTKNTNEFQKRLRKEASSKRNNPFKRELPTTPITVYKRGSIKTKKSFKKEKINEVNKLLKKSKHHNEKFIKTRRKEKKSKKRLQNE